MTVLDDSFTALAHPIRRAIVERLAGGTATIGEATRGFGVSKPAITKHVRVLEDAGVVVRTVEGRTHRLRLDGRPLAEAGGWMARQHGLWTAKLDVVQRYLDDQRTPGQEP
jgi:DNA-binding transcriptional ArsR family regulator